MGMFDHIVPPEGQPGTGAPQPAAPSVSGGGGTSPLYDLFRSAGTGLRRGVEGALGLAGDLEQGAEWLGGKAASAMGLEMPDIPTFNATTQDIQADTKRVVGEHYEPQSTGGKYAKTIGEFAPMAALGGGGTLSGLGRALLGQAVIPGAASEAAGQATEGTAAEPWARLFGGLGGGLAGGMATLERTPRTLKQMERQRVLDAGANQGVRLPSYMMPDAPVAEQIASRTVDIPFLGGPVRRASEQAAEDIGNRTQELARQVGNPDMPTATFEAHDALRRFQTTASRAFKQQLYDEVDRHIQPGITTPLRNTQAMVRQILNEADATTVRSHELAVDLVGEAIRRPRGLTYEGLKQLRTDIGARMSGKITPEPGTNQPLLKRIYGALTDDLEQAVIDSGGQPALDAWRTANQMTRALEEVSGAVASVIGKRGEVTPQNAMKTIRHLATAEDPSVRNRLSLIRMAMDEARPGAWEDVGAAVLSYIGRDPKNPAQFSPAKMVENYGKMSREGRVLLFGNDVADALDDLAVLSRQHKPMEASKFGVPLQAGVGLGVGAAALANWPATLTAIFGANMTARLLSRPATAQKVVSWARASQGARGATPASVIQAAKALADAVEDETGQDSGDVLDKLLNGGGQWP